MTYIDPSLKVLLEVMVNYPTRDNVLPKYKIVLQEIRTVLQKIKDCQDEACANDYFDQLQEIQGPLSVLVFKERIDEYPSIDKFVRDFDRIDDAQTRKDMFNAIKNEGYDLSKRDE